MITGELKSKVDAVWNAFATGGIADPLEVIGQVTYLLFIKRLDDLQAAKEKKASVLRLAVDEPIFKDGEHHLRWSQFKNLPAPEMFETVDREVFPFIKTFSGPETTFAQFMQNARLAIPTPGLLAKVVDLIDQIPMEDRDTKGDVYEYMLGKIASAGRNGQFRTPRHIIKLMVDMLAPKPTDTVCDPACGTAGFLVAATEYLFKHHQSEIFSDEKLKAHFYGELFNGFDFDNTMLRIGAMNMMLHGVENPNIRYRDSLAEAYSSDEELYSVILANPPFTGSLDFESTAKNLLQTVKTKQTELLFIALFVRLLMIGGRAAVIVPDGVLSGASKSHRVARQQLVDKQKLDAVISMPAGVFKPYAGVSTAILFFTKTNSGGTDNVWFYDMQADGFSLNDKRTELDQSKHSDNNLPDILRRWRDRAAEVGRKRTEQSFLVTKEEIIANNYDLRINLYKEIVHEELNLDPPDLIFAELRKLENEIQAELNALESLIR